MVEEIKNYKTILPSGLVVRNTIAADAEQLEELQHIVFPNLSDEEILHAPQYIRHTEIFPEGQFVITDSGRIVAATTTMRYHYNENDTSHHTFFDIMGGGWLTTHDPHGEWMYGLDMGVHPGYRGKGLAKELYKVRHHTCRLIGLAGQMTVGMLNGYIKHKDAMTIDAYYEKVKSGELFDPTVSVQAKIGFKIKGLMKDYLNDPTCGNAGALIVLDVNTPIP